MVFKVVQHYYHKSNQLQDVALSGIQGRKVRNLLLRRLILIALRLLTSNEENYTSEQPLLVASVARSVDSNQHNKNDHDASLS